MSKNAELPRLKNSTGPTPNFMYLLLAGLPFIQLRKKLNTPIEYLNFFFDSEVIEAMLVFTNQYAAKKNLLGDITETELWSFIEILILSGYDVLP